MNHNSVYVLSTDRVGYFQFSVQNWQKLQECSTAEDAAMLEDAAAGEHCRFTAHLKRQNMAALTYK